MWWSAACAATFSYLQQSGTYIHTFNLEGFSDVFQAFVTAQYPIGAPIASIIDFSENHVTVSCDTNNVNAWVSVLVIGRA